MKAGFCEVDISPQFFPIRTYSASASELMDPIYAHAAVFSDKENTIAFLSLDLVIIESEYVQAIRERVTGQCGIPGRNIMVCATHNHACPAVVDRPGCMKEPDYIDFMIDRGAKAVTMAFKRRRESEIGVASGFEGRVSFNRRFIRKDGTVITQPSLESLRKDVLCNEGVIDPGLGVVCARGMNGTVTGMMVNFACHAVHHMGKLSAGYPGILNTVIKKQYGDDCACLFLNGACGNIIHRNFADPDQADTKEHIGTVLATDVIDLIEDMEFRPDLDIDAASETISLKYRDITEMEARIDDPSFLVNVFPVLIERGWYRYSLEELKKLTAEADGVRISIQALRVGAAFFTAIPAEYFTEHGLRIKLESPGVNTFVVSLANGWLGYIPTAAALDRKGGHETSIAHWSKMRADTGDLMAEAAIRLISDMHREALPRDTKTVQDSGAVEEVTPVPA